MNKKIIIILTLVLIIGCVSVFGYSIQKDGSSLFSGTQKIRIVNNTRLSINLYANKTVIFEANSASVNMTYIKLQSSKLQSVKIFDSETQLRRDYFLGYVNYFLPQHTVWQSLELMNLTYISKEYITLKFFPFTDLVNSITLKDYHKGVPTNSVQVVEDIKSTGAKVISSEGTSLFKTEVNYTTFLSLCKTGKTVAIYQHLSSSLTYVFDDFDAVILEDGIRTHNSFRFKAEIPQGLTINPSDLYTLNLSP